VGEIPTRPVSLGIDGRWTIPTKNQYEDMKNKAAVSFLGSPDYRLALIVVVFVVVVEIAHNGRSHYQILFNTKGDGP
jgi:hypothetical protein